MDIAVYRLASSSALDTEERRTRYRDAVRYLERVAEGKIRLGADDDRPRHPQRPQVTSRERRFSRRTF